MRKLLPLLACIMLVLSMWTGVAEAGGNAACDEASWTQVTMPVSADCDQVPADADRDYPHHHAACHGHHLAAPDESRHLLAGSPVPAAFIAGEQRVLHDRDGDRSLRPPQA